MDYGEGYTSSFMVTFPRLGGRLANLDACYLVKTKTGSKYQKEELAKGLGGMASSREVDKWRIPGDPR